MEKIQAHEIRFSSGRFSANVRFKEDNDKRLNIESIRISMDIGEFHVASFYAGNKSNFSIDELTDLSAFIEDLSREITTIIYKLKEIH
jgi:hypothetical protein